MNKIKDNLYLILSKRDGPTPTVRDASGRDMYASKAHAGIIIKVRRCDHLFISKRTADARCRATRSDRRGIYRYPKYIHFHFGHYAQVEERVTGAGVIGTGIEAGDTTGSGRVLPRANDIVTITVTTYPSTE